MTCDRPIRDRSGEPLPGKLCNLDKGHLGKCAVTYDAAAFFDAPGGPGNVFSGLPIFTEPHTTSSILGAAIATPHEPSGPSRPADPT